MAHELSGLPLNVAANISPDSGLRRGFIACAALALLATGLPPATAGESKLSDETIAAAVSEPSRPATDTARDAGVFDPSIQGRTDQFILKFRRPRSS